MYNKFIVPIYFMLFATLGPQAIASEAVPNVVKPVGGIELHQSNYRFNNLKADTRGIRLFAGGRFSENLVFELGMIQHKRAEAYNYPADADVKDNGIDISFRGVFDLSPTSAFTARLGIYRWKTDYEFCSGFSSCFSNKENGNDLIVAFGFLLKSPKNNGSFGINFYQLNLNLDDVDAKVKSRNVAISINFGL